MRRIHLSTVEGPRLEVPPEAEHHLRRVLRLRDGAEVVAFDGGGAEVHGVLRFGDDGAWLEPTGPVQRISVGPPVEIVLSVSRGPAMDDAVRMATECGATAIHLAVTARSAPTGPRVDRWTRKAEAAARQCGRADVPVLTGPQPLAAAVEQVSASPLWVAVPGSDEPPRSTERGGAVVIGPEGGLTADEIERLLARGARPCRLGPHVLRVATAVAVATAWLHA